MNKNKQNRTPLFDAMKKFREAKVTPFDVPGHKRGRGLSEFTDYFGQTLMDLDVNSMKELDNLSNPIGVIKESEDLMAEAYGADHAFFLVNGTSQGVQAMIMSVCSPGDKIILPRNAHKSAINALILSSATPIYIQPEVDYELGISLGVSFESVKKAIEENPDAKAVFIINPTYYGACSDLKKIIELAHANNMQVLVDEAHGAHFNFSDKLPHSAMSLGADMAAVSMHKTGGSLTQSSVLLLNDRGIQDHFSIKTILNLTQTTSASYLLMASLDLARKNLVINGEKDLDEVLKLVQWARNEINNIDGFYAFSSERIDGKGLVDFDPTKLGINCSGLGKSGFFVYDTLRDEYGVQMELADAYNTMGIITGGDSMESVGRLVEALRDISKKYKNGTLKVESLDLENPQMVVTPRVAFYSHKKVVKLDDAIGQVSGESIMAYPPGIPIVTPGEKITKKNIEYIKYLKEQHSILNGTEDPNADYIKILG